MKRTDFYFDLPKEFIAQHPLEDRSSSKLMVLDLEKGGVDHRIFKDIVDEFSSGDMIILNNTKVIPARLFGNKETGGKVEILLVDKLDQNVYEAFVRGKNLKEGSRVIFQETGLEMLLGPRVSGIRHRVDFSSTKKTGDLEDLIYSIGVAPTPPYIKEELGDPKKYQTVYAKHPGSIAAPTAGFHFTPELMEQIREKGVSIQFVTLHVGVGTFNPVKADNLEDHKMEVEVYEVAKGVADAVNKQVRSGNRIWVVGTTSLRTLESAFKDGELISGSSETGLFIYPGYKFNFPFSRFITNFHLPESTLIMLVSAITGRERILSAYEEAKEKRYRFYSFGDACLIKRRDEDVQDHR